VNETLCRALLQARLSEEDVAARLQVDPKTVRRWLDGRLPYLRHRWAIAALLGMDEGDLWPQVRTTRTRPAEVVAIYPHRDAVPSGIWLRMLASAKREIAILDDDGLFFAELPGVAGTLAARAEAGVRVRICLADPDCQVARDSDMTPDPGDQLAAGSRAALTVFRPPLWCGSLEIRLHQVVLPSSLCRADDELLVCQHAHGMPPAQWPVLRLRRAGANDMVTAYLESFERIWAKGRSLA
jgi:hypothetical protein